VRDIAPLAMPSWSGARRDADAYARAKSSAWYIPS
jgi:hypothetical protein